MASGPLQIFPAQAAPIIVMKFGGAALATPEHVVRAAQRIRDQIRSGVQAIVVVSAMGDETDRLLNLTQQVGPGTNLDEIDTVLCAGEQVAAGMMALSLRTLGIPARSFLASQLPIIADGQSGDAQIISVEIRPLIEALKEGVIPVVAGFQGVNRESRLVTLGRGGSDTTAVAIAASTGADACEFYKDVDGVYTANPADNCGARKFNFLTYGEMETLTAAGAEVLQSRAVRMAARFCVALHVRSAFLESEGTRIGSEIIHQEVSV